jgi:hypothetical protein
LFCFAGKLIKDIWSDKYSSVRPEEFKRNIGEFAPQFSGDLVTVDGVTSERIAYMYLWGVLL